MAAARPRAGRAAGPPPRLRARGRQAAAARVLPLGLRRRRRRRGGRGHRRRGCGVRAPAGLRPPPRRRDGRLRRAPWRSHRPPRLRRSPPRLRLAGRGPPVRRGRRDPPRRPRPRATPTGSCRGPLPTCRSCGTSCAPSSTPASTWTCWAPPAAGWTARPPAASPATSPASTPSSGRCTSAPRWPAASTSWRRRCPPRDPLGEAFQLRDDLLGAFGDEAAPARPSATTSAKASPTAARHRRRAGDAAQAEVLARVGGPDLDTAAMAKCRDVLRDTGTAAAIERHRGTGRRGGGVAAHGADRSGGGRRARPSSPTSSPAAPHRRSAQSSAAKSFSASATEHSTTPGSATTASSHGGRLTAADRDGDVEPGAGGRLAGERRGVVGRAHVAGQLVHGPRIRGAARRRRCHRGRDVGRHRPRSPAGQAGSVEQHRPPHLVGPRPGRQQADVGPQAATEDGGCAKVGRAPRRRRP